ncbi:disease resistance protein RPV1-like [Rhodamnia argentea]|uniref:Disease resistance protein RPV1-like n=1 Tax=Rhodamnia argentea TaxID=178133 RepID=A0ABM3HJG7_9MYRT|nr:disease resistance protein RPV1-like [Rhodamnia argentea]
MENNVAESTQPDLRLKWDVFLSFRGEDTRHAFIGPLYDALRSKDVRAFGDNEGMNRGDQISPSLLAAIEDSAVAIVVISPDYAGSHWCLEELAKICECRKLILPVFYGVEPSDVRHQRGPFEGAFERHVKRFGDARVSAWRAAMRQAGGVSGWIFRGQDDRREMSLLIQDLVHRIMDELNNVPLHVAPLLVGLDSRIEQLLASLSVKSGGVKFLGLHGFGGVGKTTLAKALYNKLVAHFEKCSFVADIREAFLRSAGLISLQDKILRDLSPDMPPSNDLGSRKNSVKHALNETRVLLVLDDIDDAGQLDALISGKEWFHEGSRVIITTRNREALAARNCAIEPYEVRELSFEDALRLFSYHALKREKPTDEFVELSKQIVSLAGNLPLALEVFGSFLVDKRRKTEWEGAVQKLKQIRPYNLQDTLKISYEGLDEETKCMFLDAACLFAKSHMTREEAIEIWEGCGFKAEIGLRVLVSRSLIKIQTNDDILWMHDQLRDMGREIVLLESARDPGTRSRLWDRKEIMAVFKDGSGTRNIEGIVLDYPHKPFATDPSSKRLSQDNFMRTPNLASAIQCLQEKFRIFFDFGAERENEEVLRAEYFKPIINLRLLQINHAKLEGKFKFLPQSLKWLQWKECSLTILPPDFCPRGLAVLDLANSKIERLWKANRNKAGENLLVVNLRGCVHLASIPDLSASRSLKKLVLERCTSLTQVPESIGSLNALVHLNLEGCSKLVGLPKDVSGLGNLEELILSGCTNLEKLPEDMDSMKSLKLLLLDGTPIKRLPEKIFHLTKLEKLHLNRCTSLKKLPNHIGMMASLRELTLNDTGIEELPDSVRSLQKLELLSLMRCASLTELPGFVGDLESLKELLIDGSKIRELPASIGSLLYLKTLSIGDCRFSSHCPDSINGLHSLTELSLGGPSITSLPAQLGALKMLQRLEIRNCESLESLPESIGNLWNLTTMILYNVNITELPQSIGNLENVVVMRLNKCKRLCKLPPSMGHLRSLYHLIMEETAVTELPGTFGMLSKLVTLRMGKKPRYTVIPEVNTETENRDLITEEIPGSMLPSSLSNLSWLEELNARAWYMRGKVPDDFEKLVSLETLNLGYNNFTSLPASLKGLSVLKNLLLPHCKELKSLPPLPSSLEFVNIAGCVMIETVPDLSELENLQELNMANCEKVVDVPGLQCLKSLRRLYLTGCRACSSVVKTRISKSLLLDMFI